MGVALTLEVPPSRRAALLTSAAPAVAAAGALLAAAQVALGPTLMLEGPAALRPLVAAGMVVPAVALAAWAWVLLRRAAAPAAAALAVDAAGAPWVHDTRGAPARPVVLRASCVLPGLIVLVLAPYPQHAAASKRGHGPLTLMLGRDTLPDDDWRRVMRWLRWMERGRHDPPVVSSRDT
jgi:hypothetical protein